MEIIYDKPYFLKQTNILQFYVTRTDDSEFIDMFCKSPSFIAKDFVVMSMEMGQFELYALKHMKKYAKEIYGKLLERGLYEDASINPMQEFGEYLIADELIFKVYATDMESEDWVRFVIDGVGLDNEDRTGEINGYRKLKHIGFDLYDLAMQQGYNDETFHDYLFALLQLESIEDYYESDRASYILKAILGPLAYWRHKDVKPLREELKQIAKLC